MLPNGLTWWNIVSKDGMDLAIRQSENLLKETVSTAQSIQDKSDKLTALFVPVFSALFVYIITYKGSLKDTILLIAVFAIANIAIVLVFLCRNLIPYKINVSGADANEFLNDGVIIKDENADYQFLKIGMMICNNNKIRVDKNDISNKLRSDRVANALIALFIGLPICPLLGYLLHLLSVNCF